MFWSLLLFVLALLLYLLGSIAPALCLVCALSGLIYFIYELGQVVRVLRKGEGFKNDLGLSYVKPFAHVGGLPLIQGQTCFLALKPQGGLAFVADNYQESVPLKKLDRVLALRRKQVKPFVRHLQRLSERDPHMTKGKVEHLLNGLKPAIPLAWNGLLVLELDEEQRTRMVVLRPLWGTRSWDILKKPVIQDYGQSPDRALADLVSHFDQAKKAKQIEKAEAHKSLPGEEQTQAKHKLKKADLAKPVHVDKEDYYES